MNTENRFIVYSDIPPLGNEGVSMSVLAHRMIAAIDNCTQSVITRRSAKKYPRADIGRGLLAPTLLSWDCAGLGLKFIREPLRSRMDIALLNLWIRFQKKKGPLRPGAREIIGLPGPHWHFLPRLSALAAELDLPYSVYVIDDFESTAAHQGANPAKIAFIHRQIKAHLKAASRVFSICPGMAERLREHYGVESIVLYPIADAPQPLPTPPEHITPRELVYVGALGQPYLDTLLEVAHLLETTPGLDWTLKLIGQDRKTYARHFTQFKRVRQVSGCDREALQREVAQSEAFLIPYSFAPEWRITAETSFPSKFLDALTAVKPSVVLAPKTSSISRHIHAANLGFCADGPIDFVELLTRRPWNQEADWAKGYRALFTHLHSTSAASTLFNF